MIVARIGNIMSSLLLLMVGDRTQIQNIIMLHLKIFFNLVWTYVVLVQWLFSFSFSPFFTIWCLLSIT